MVECKEKDALSPPKRDADTLSGCPSIKVA
jgi:hypothetical protein